MQDLTGEDKLLISNPTGKRQKPESADKIARLGFFVALSGPVGFLLGEPNEYALSSL